MGLPAKPVSTWLRLRKDELKLRFRKEEPNLSVRVKKEEHKLRLGIGKEDSLILGLGLGRSLL